MPRKAIPVIDRLMARVVENDNGCWVFTGATYVGYGVIGLGSREDGTSLTHRVTYRYFVGDIPEGLDLDHLCRNRACCNPWHLEPVTRWVNANRGLRARGYREPVCRNGHEYVPGSHVVDYRPNGEFKSRRCLICQRARYQRKEFANV